MQVNISEFFLHLLTQKNFYARVAASMKRVEVPGMGTMGVGIRGGRITLFYDPDFVSKISIKFGAFVLEHEVMHVILDHIPRWLEMLARWAHDEDQKTKAKVVYNIAMDCAVNDLLSKHAYFEGAEAEFKAIIEERISPESKASMTSDQKHKMGMVTPAKQGLEENRSFDYYQGELMKKVKLLPPDQVAALMKQWMESMGDAHGNWQDSEGSGGEGTNGEGSVALPEELQGLAHQLRTQLKQLLRTAVREQNRSRGTIPSEVEEWLAEYLADPIVPWWSILNTRILTSKRVKPDRGICRPNRMLTAMSEEDVSIMPVPGRIKDPRFRVFFYVDTSGSMSTESLMIARGELNNLLKTDDDLEVRYMQGDCVTHFDRVYHSGEELPQEVHGRGGTDFDEYFRYMGQYFGNDETEPDIAIVYTDGYAPGVQESFRFPAETPVVWLVTREHSAESLHGYGEVIVCSAEQNEMWKHSNK